MLSRQGIDYGFRRQLILSILFWVIVSTSPSKVGVVLCWKALKSVMETRNILGLTGYYHSCLR